MPDEFTLFDSVEDAMRMQGALQVCRVLLHELHAERGRGEWIDRLKAEALSSIKNADLVNVPDEQQVKAYSAGIAGVEAGFAMLEGSS
jgi:hypothetical protein